MGKTKRPKTRPKHINPLGIPSLRDLEKDDSLLEDELQSGGPIEAIRGQLQSSNIEEKLNGLQSLAVLSACKDKVEAICRSDVIRIAAPLLFEPCEPVRNAAAGSLRNLSVYSVDVCENLVEQDVLTPLLALLSEYARYTSWVPTFNESLKGQLDIKSDIFLQAINLLWNLCESTSVALDNFNQSHILESFIRYLDYKIFGLDISIAVAQCLLVISENNANSWNVLSNHTEEFICLLSTFGDYSHTYLRTLATGILSNVPALSAAYSKEILKALSITLDVNHRKALCEISSIIPLVVDKFNTTPELVVNMDLTDDNTEEAALNRRMQDLPTDTDIAIRKVEYLLEAQRLSAEIITNHCSNDDEEWIDDGSIDLSDAESVADYDDECKGNSNTNLQNGDSLPVSVLEAIKSLGLVEKLWEKAQPIPENVYQILSEHKPNLAKKIKNLRTSSMLCLQNLCNSMCTEDLGGPEAVYAVWVELGQQVFKGPQDPFVIEASTSLMRSALEHLKSSKDLFKQMTQNDLELILNGVNNCSESEIRANWLRMLGSLGCLLSDSLVKVIIAFILQTCLKEEDVWTISEAVDALMDMFSDNDWNQIVLDLNLYKKAKEIEVGFKSKIRQQKRELKDRYPAVMTVRTNFSRFIKYIEEESIKFVANVHKNN